MHKRPSLRLGLFAFGALIAVITYRYGWQSTTKVTPPRPPVSVSVQNVVRKDMQKTIETVGTLISPASVALKARIETEVRDIHVEEGADVKEGDLLISLDDRLLQAQLKQAQAEGSRLEAILLQTKKDALRAEELFARKTLSPTARDQQITNLKAAEANFAANKALQKALETQLSFTRITAPFSGRLGIIHAKPGAMVRPGDTTSLVTINQMTPLHVTFGVSTETAADLKALKNLQEATLTLERTQEKGSVFFIDNAFDTATGTLTVKGLVNNEDKKHWPGEFIRLQLRTGMDSQALVVPEVSVQRGQKGPYVFRITPENKAEIVPVTVVRTEKNEAVVAGPLQEGDKVVTSGNLMLFPGATVVQRSQPKTEQGKGP